MPWTAFPLGKKGRLEWALRIWLLWQLLLSLHIVKRCYKACCVCWNQGFCMDTYGNTLRKSYSLTVLFHGSQKVFSRLWEQCQLFKGKVLHSLANVEQRKCYVSKPRVPSQDYSSCQWNALSAARNDLLLKSFMASLWIIFVRDVASSSSLSKYCERFSHRKSR